MASRRRGGAAALGGEATGRYSIVECAAPLGHNSNVCLSTYAHMRAELGDTRGVAGGGADLGRA